MQPGKNEQLDVGPVPHKMDCLLTKKQAGPYFDPGMDLSQTD
jgi:hypothetical protein